MIADSRLQWNCKVRIEERGVVFVEVCKVVRRSVCVEATWGRNFAGIELGGIDPTNLTPLRGLGAGPITEHESMLIPGRVVHNVLFVF